MDKIKLGIIGTGSVVREIYQYLYFHSEYSSILSIEAAADLNEGSLHDFADKYDIPKERRFTDYKEMLEEVELDAVQINTPDSFHRVPTVDALERGLDVVLPKPLADKTADARAMIDAARKNERLLLVDFHKRDDPRIIDAATRYQSGVYGRFQCGIWYMLDKLFVADPNHSPRFFATPDFAVKNSPITFLTVHMADAFMRIVDLKPATVRATAYSQKLPSLSPISVNGLDLCDTELVMEDGSTAHIITGWHLPNTAYSTTVQASRLICTDGLIDLGLDLSGIREIVNDGIYERNPLFRTFHGDGSVSGYGMTRPGRLYQHILKYRNGEIGAAQYEQLMSLFELGFYTTVVCEAAERSLADASRNGHGIIRGGEIDLGPMLK